MLESIRGETLTPLISHDFVQLGHRGFIRRDLFGMRDGEDRFGGLQFVVRELLKREQQIVRSAGLLLVEVPLHALWLGPRRIAA